MKKNIIRVLGFFSGILISVCILSSSAFASQTNCGSSEVEHCKTQCNDPANNQGYKSCKHDTHKSDPVCTCCTLNDQGKCA